MNLKKILTGFLAFSPLAFYVGLVFFSIITGAGEIDYSTASSVTMVVVGILVLLTALGSWLGFIISIAVNKEMRPKERVGWIFGVLFGSYLALPVYWFLYIVMEETKQEKHPA